MIYEDLKIQYFGSNYIHCEYKVNLGQAGIIRKQKSYSHFTFMSNVLVHGTTKYLVLSTNNCIVMYIIKLIFPLNFKYD